MRYLIVFIIFLLASATYANSPFEDGVYEGEIRKFKSDGTMERGTLTLKIDGNYAHGVKSFPGKDRTYEVFADFSNQRYFKIYANEQTYKSKMLPVGDGLCAEDSCQYSLRITSGSFAILGPTLAAVYHSEVFVKTETGLRGYGNIAIELLGGKVVRSFWISDLDKKEE